MDRLFSETEFEIHTNTFKSDVLWLRNSTERQGVFDGCQLQTEFSSKPEEDAGFFAGDRGRGGSPREPYGVLDRATPEKVETGEL